ncbi:MAG: DUF4169 family protein [Rhodospirillaceae bacterium]|jgi:hypothetical protein|nr:DUF4169 family protein [Rhodospirillaceae bacterium]MBT4219365.1 DUF4169 family protein [Rhodospirillaceae bacterium]MBT4464714.1 DUF4169 family protein [Rhodospirillaceae bacterium]MBT7355271.1 DUF4169 family protein [Rhodospirillaceae bacterium]
MAEIVNLNKARKAKAKADKKASAEENRVRFGQTKADKANNKISRDHHDAHLNGLRIYNPGKKDDDEPA